MIGNCRIAFKQRRNALHVGALNRLFHQSVLDNAVLNPKRPENGRVGRLHCLRQVPESRRPQWMGHLQDRS